MSHYLQVPTELLPYAGKLSATQLLIWADAWMFKKNTGKAYRTNAQLSEMLNVTERSVSRAVQELIRMGAITVQSNGRNRVIDPVQPSEWKVDVDVHRRKRPPTQTSTDVDVHAEPTQTSMQTGRIRPCSTDADVHLIYKGIDKEIDKGIDKREAKPKIEIVMPWESDEFADAWQEWKSYKKAEHGFKFKSANTEQTALHKLHQDAKGNEQLAIYAIATSISNGWKGTFINAKLEREFDSRKPQGELGDWTPEEFKHWLSTGEMPNPHRGAF